jgi:hypothetical protein
VAALSEGECQADRGYLGRGPAKVKNRPLNE